MKILCIILAALICLPVLAFAVHDSVVTGSYNSSFDLGLLHYGNTTKIEDPIEEIRDETGANFILDQSTIDALSREREVGNIFQGIRNNPEEIRAFFLSMPKGGDIHNHLTGAVYAEDLIDAASSERLCIYSNNYTVTKCTGSQNTIPLSQAYRNERLYNNIVDAWSMKNSELLNVSGHDQFFSTFGRFGGATKNTSLLVAELRSRAALEKVEYLELMTGVNTSSKASSLGNWNENLSICYDDLIKGGLKELAKKASINLSENDAKSIKILEAGDPGRDVTVKYLCTVSRIKPKKEVFAQLALAFEVANKSPLAVGINLLSAEDNRTAREDYSLHMLMIDFLHGKYPNVKIALHAGELELGLVPPEDLRSHIQEAVEVGHASRIGHGVDVMRENNSQKTLSEMNKGKVAVEIMPVSNKEILGISGEDHPFPVYMSRGVPIVLASDDPGVLRTDLTEQFVVIAHTYPQVNYSDIKRFVRNSLEYSFLRGDGIWAFPGSYSQLKEECAGCRPGTVCEKCKAFLDKNEKAKAQWRLEGDLAFFESRIYNWRTFGGNRDDRGYSVQETRDGGYIIAGCTNSFGSGKGNYNVFLVRTKPDGKSIPGITGTIGGPKDDYGCSVQETRDGGYIVAGYTNSYGNGSNDTYLIKTDSDRTKLWERTFGGPFDDYGYSVQETRDGGYIVVGCTNSYDDGGYNAYLIKTDSHGTKLWQRTFGGPFDDYGYSVQETRDGGYIISGATQPSREAYPDAWLIKTDSHGTKLWEKTFGGRDGHGYSVRETRDGGYIIAGTTRRSDTNWINVWLIKTNSSGNMLWERTFGGQYLDSRGYSVQETRDGGYIIAGYTLRTEGKDVWLIKTDSSGNMLWDRIFGGPKDDWGQSVQETSDGGYTIAGVTDSFGAGGDDIWLIHLRNKLPES